MGRALPVSAVLHAVLLLAAVWLARGARPDDSVALESIAVSIISIQSAADSTTQTPSDATEALVAAGAVAPTDPDPVASPAPERIESVRSASLPAPLTAEPVAAPVEKLAAVPMAEASAAPAEKLAAVTDDPVAAVLTAVVPAAVDAISAPSAAVEPATPVAPARLPIAPVPAEPAPVSPATVAVVPKAVRPAAADVATPEPVAVYTPVAQPAPRPHPAKPKPRAAANAGAGGRAKASVAAAPATRGGAARVDRGGDAAATRYPGLVLAQLRRALRRPASGGFGEVKVGFTVLAGGDVTDIRVVASSGTAALDQAAADTVRRAAPFPPIPPTVHRASWRFVMPLTFR